MSGVLLRENVLVTGVGSSFYSDKWIYEQLDPLPIPFYVQLLFELFLCFLKQWFTASKGTPSWGLEEVFLMFILFYFNISLDGADLWVTWSSLFILQILNKSFESTYLLCTAGWRKEHELDKKDKIYLSSDFEILGAPREHQGHTVQPWATKILFCHVSLVLKVWKRR